MKDKLSDLRRKDGSEFPKEVREVVALLQASGGELDPASMEILADAAEGKITFDEAVEALLRDLKE